MSLLLSAGVLCPDSKMGIYACDFESLDVFEELFEPMILQYFNTNQYHPECNFGDLKNDDIKDVGILSMYIPVGM